MGSRSFEIEIDGPKFRLDGQLGDAVLHRVPGTPVALLRLGGSARSVVVRRQGDVWMVELSGERVVVQVLDEHVRNAGALGGGRPITSVAGVVRAPMPGLVLRLEVAPGDSVRAGSGLLVLEAMKMENEIRAAVAGVVKAVLVHPGQVVEKGTALVEVTGRVDPPPEGR